ATATPEQLKKALADIQTGQKQESLMHHTVTNGSYVKIAKDQMMAWLYLMPPEPGTPMYNRDDIESFLAENGVLCGYHSSNLGAIVKKGIFEREIKIAIGKLPKDGRNGTYEYLFNTLKRTSPVIREDGTADYASLGLVENVHVGDVIAKYRHPVPGEDGYTVTGRDLPCRKAIDIPLKRGKGVDQDPNNPDQYIATMDGKVEIVQDRLEVYAVHEIPRDVTYVDGKIEFFGDIIIHGNVLSGVTIRCGRNVDIRGTCEAADIFAGGDVILQRGILGGSKGKISAHGNVMADFIENAHIECGGSVKSNSIINSDISAEGKVVITGKSGAIYGGRIHALLSIEANIIGNESYVQTIVHAGYEVDTYEKYLRFNRMETTLATSLDKLTEQLKILLKDKRKPENRNNTILDSKIESLNISKNKFQDQLEQTKKDKALFAEILEKGRGGKIMCIGKIYPGVTIGIGAMKMPVEDVMTSTKFYDDNGALRYTTMVL
ncbi:MAG: FapA family protein, partial [Lachnospiraceae bacterium]|nr:FapA family protein [Lachnospiraceae bacterium]